MKLGFTGVYIIFLISAQKIDCGYSLEPPRRGGSNEYQQSMFWVEIWKNIRIFIWNSQFLVVKFSVYLNRRVFVMNRITMSPITDIVSQMPTIWNRLRRDRAVICCPFDITWKDFVCLAFYFKWKYFVLFDHILSETICLFYTERKKKRRVNFISKFHSSLKKFV